MENAPVGSKQRSPWIYALFGCLGLAGLMCLGFGAVAFFGVKAVKDIGDGVTDPQERQANAIKQLGSIPTGYNVVASMSIFGLMQTTLLTDSPLLADGGFGFDETPNGHTFTYFRIVGNENNKKAQDFLSGKNTDPSALTKSGINIDAKDIIKRGQLKVDGRKLSWVASRGEMASVNHVSTGLNTIILFECGSDALQVGVWSQGDPAPGQPSETLDLAGTVADEAELARFLKPLNPCGR